MDIISLCVINVSTLFAGDRKDTQIHHLGPVKYGFFRDICLGFLRDICLGFLRDICLGFLRDICIAAGCVHL